MLVSRHTFWSTGGFWMNRYYFRNVKHQNVISIALGHKPCLILVLIYWCAKLYCTASHESLRKWSIVDEVFMKYLAKCWRRCITLPQPPITSECLTISLHLVKLGIPWCKRRFVLWNCLQHSSWRIYANRCSVTDVRLSFWLLYAHWWSSVSFSCKLFCLP